MWSDAASTAILFGALGLDMLQDFYFYTSGMPAVDQIFIVLLFAGFLSFIPMMILINIRINEDAPKSNKSLIAIFVSASIVIAFIVATIITSVSSYNQADENNSNAMKSLKITEEQVELLIKNAPPVNSDYRVGIENEAGNFVVAEILSSYRGNPQIIQLGEYDESLEELPNVTIIEG